ncbi:serine/threonine protein kinase HT1, putative [Entamoeba invadens IP1]|uniref:serine/threonine protein kinase HT1, putative n=1 Tax=Entamoeba invadens IP1 TaxID=370355 RepID=UPI0002C3E6B8|nr:serine/threonine protein kinase HT1, putative [Entamoeba invadens IP1]ELP90737.1 serine/threonine protein kinase HT1, putative [Entamoeba invadens IP1]|eukprot:XP_004257508.1 serine/threonine protein kinase HT1, putative [Entamoeba invadens IP1]
MYRLNERQWSEMEKTLEPHSKGSQGKVYKAKLLRMDVAVKRYNNPEEFVKELICLNNCTSEYIVSVCGMTPTADAIFLDWYPSDLENYVLTNSPRVPESVQLMKDLCHAVQYVHRVGYIHLDIRPKNVLVKMGHCVLCDFGLAIRDQEPYDHTRGVDTWVAPEIVFGRVVSTKTDVYSLGLVIWFTLESQGSAPFIATTTVPMIKAAMQTKERPRWNFSNKGPYLDVCKQIADVTKKCWAEEQEKRPAAAVVAAKFDDWVKEVK